MRLFVAAVSYIVYAWSVASFGWLYLLLPQTTDQFGNVTYSPDALPYFAVAYIVSVVFMVLSPYFGIAALQGSASVWKRAVELIERHISFPFLAVLLLYYGRYGSPVLGFAPSNSLGYNVGVGIVASIYTALVIMASVMVLMAGRHPKTAPPDIPAEAPTGSGAPGLPN